MLQYKIHTEPEHPSSSNVEETSLGCVESINVHSLQTSQSHVLVAWMVSPPDSENNLIITVLSGSRETRLVLSDYLVILK